MREPANVVDASGINETLYRWLGMLATGFGGAICVLLAYVAGAQ